MAKLATLMEQHLDRQPPTVVTQATTWWETVLAHVKIQEIGLGVNLPVNVCCFSMSSEKILQDTSSQIIAGNFQEEKLSRNCANCDFFRENFPRLLTFGTLKDATPPNFMEKTFVKAMHKTVKFAKVFSLETFPLAIWYNIS